MCLWMSLALMIVVNNPGSWSKMYPMLTDLCPYVLALHLEIAVIMYKKKIFIKL